MGYLIRTVNGKTVYLAKVTDRLVTTVNQLQSALRQIDSTFSDWQTQLKLFAKNEKCHFNNFMEFLSKFSLEVTRTFSHQLRFTEINDILHQAHKLHNKQLVGFTALPSFVATALQYRLETIPSLQDTVTALSAGYPLLIQPFVDYQYHMGKSVAINFLFTIPELTSANSLCTIEYLMPLKYNLSGICFQGPVIRDELALLRCQHTEYILHRSLLGTCYRTDETFVYPQHILQLVNDTSWLGLPWHRDTQFNFVRRHQKAPDCSNINELFHLGGRYYLSTQHGSINVYNTTNGSSRILHISPLIVYHFPCDLTFASQQTGLGTCPDRITFHLPLFSHKSFRYIPWTHNDDKTLRLHYSSLNLTPSLQFDNKTTTSLDHTFRILDGQLTTRLATLKDEISHLHKVQSTTLNDWLTYFTFVLVSIHSFVFIILYCCSIKPKSFPSMSTTVLSRRKSASAQRKDTATANADDHELHELQPATSQNQNSVCPTCNKPVPL